ncbi:hypothetical protein C6P45_001319 [Maudiozyma exigua]|uniref:RanBD1 domain-containing protein n=1 Tax=Maudiozyma exigua TaxID=34358 RepID=A0A9P6WFE4_MAUEX|nr:hypothetical protein C6P45_001319 [Kazachstania exigua]
MSDTEEKKIVSKEPVGKTEKDNNNNNNDTKEVTTGNTEKNQLKRTRSNETEEGEDNETKKVKLTETEPESTKEEDKKVEKSKFVFGSTTKFGTGFKIAEKSNTTSKDSSDDASEKPKPTAFGSGFSFGSGFGVLKKDVDTEKSSTTTEEKKKSGEDKDKESSDKSNNEVITENGDKIRLHKQDVKSGEELEETVFQVNAKLYKLINMKEGWKERGTGVIKVNKDSKSDKSRVIMRTRTVLKVILNLPIVKGITLMKGFPGSLQSEKFIRIIGIDENNKPVTYALKTGKEETSEELYKSINDLIPK